MYCSSSSDSAVHGWKYGFSNEETPRVTELITISNREFQILSTNNLAVKRDFSKFDRLPRVAKNCNKNFIDKGIPESMILFIANQKKKD